MSTLTPLHQHDCGECEFVGSLASGVTGIGSDVYIHIGQNEHGPEMLTIVERFGNDGPEYISFSNLPDGWERMRGLRPAYALGLAYHLRGGR